MRKIVGAIALLALVLGVFLLTAPPQEKQAAGGQAKLQPASFGIYSSELADSGNASVAVVRAFHRSQGNASALSFCQSAPLQKSVIVLVHAPVPGTDPALGKRAAAALSKSGVSSREAALQDALSQENSVIIAATGALPKGILEAAQNLSKSNNRVIVLQTLAGKIIDSDGNIRQAEIGLENSSIEMVVLAPNSEENAVDEVVMRTLLPPEAGNGWGDFPQGNNTIAIAANGTEAECRLVLLSDGNALRFADTRRMAAPPGKLTGPPKLAAGSEAVFEFSPDSEGENGRALRFTAIAIEGGSEKARQQIAGGEITDGWASRFALKFPHGGKYALHIIDQFGRLHAAAYVEVLGLEAVPVSQEGMKYEFMLLLGGKAADGKVTAWIDNGERKEYSATGGKLVLWAAPAPGERVMHFEFEGAQAEYAFDAKPEGFAENCLRYAIPGAMLLAAAYFFVRSKGKVKYRITFPESALAAPLIVPVGRECIEDAYGSADKKMGGHRLPAYPHEIAACMRLEYGGRKAQPDQLSVLSVLRKLAAKGEFVECEGAFIPARAQGGFDADALFSLRVMHDLMLERGMPFARRTVNPVKGSPIELAVFAGKRKVLSDMARGRVRVLVFASDEKKNEFIEGLSYTGKPDALIRIALENGALMFASAKRGEIEPLLP